MKVSSIKRKIHSLESHRLTCLIKLLWNKKHLLKILNITAFCIVRPACRRTAKSPISWGSSWKKTAIVVPKPAVKLVANEAPIANPSLKLCRPPPKITIQAFDFNLLPLLRWLWPRLCGFFLCKFSFAALSSLFSSFT